MDKMCKRRLGNSSTTDLVYLIHCQLQLGPVMANQISVVTPGPILDNAEPLYCGHKLYLLSSNIWMIFP